MKVKLRRHKTDKDVFYVHGPGRRLATYWRAHTGDWWACLGDQAGRGQLTAVAVDGGELSAQLKAIELLEENYALQTPQTAPKVARRAGVSKTDQAQGGEAAGGNYYCSRRTG